MTSAHQRSRSRRRHGPPPKRSGTGVLIIAGIAMLAIAVVVVLIASGGDDDRSTAAGLQQTRPVTIEGAALSRVTDTGADPAVGKDAPLAIGSDFAGATETLPIGGKATMIVFAAHWCPHCQVEVPRIVEWLADGGAAGVDVVLVATGTKADAPNFPPSAWLADVRWPGRVIADDVDGTLGQAYGVATYPCIVFVKADGTVAGRIVGEQPTPALDAGIRSITAGETP